MSEEFNPNITVSFRDPETTYPEVISFPAGPSLAPEERELRRARFDKAVALVQSFERDFDATPYTYSELLAELVKRLEGERERIALASSGTGKTEGAEG